MEKQLELGIKETSTKLLKGNNLDLLKELDDNSIDAIVTDPPYFLTNSSGSGFMGKQWDSLSIKPAFVEMFLRHMKPVYVMGEESSVQKSVNTSTKNKKKARTYRALYAQKCFIEQNHKLKVSTSFALENVLTKAEALVLSREILPNLTKQIESLKENVLFVPMNIFTEKSPKNIAQESALKLATNQTCKEIEILVTLMEGPKQKDAIEGTSGTTLENIFTKETITYAENVTKSVLDERYSATTSCPIDLQKIIQKVTSLPCVKNAMAQFMVHPQNIQILSERFHTRWLEQAFRVLKPGGHILSFSGTRTYHYLAKACDFAGFEIRDQIQWIYGSGFPKSHNISKAIDKKFGAKRNVISSYKATGTARNSKNIGAKTHSAIEGEYSKDVNEIFVTSPSTPQAKQWDGWGSALKPAFEPVVLAMKPFTVADSIAKLVLELCQYPLFVRAVKQHLKLNPSVKAQQSIVQWLAEKSTPTSEDLLELMDTLRLRSMEPTNSNIELLWLSTLIEILKLSSTFTTEIISSMIIDLKTLNSLLLMSTQKGTLKKSGRGEKSIASIVAQNFYALELKLKTILDLSAIENVIDKVNSKSLLPNNEPVVLARKPLSEKTIVDNVLKWGTGGLNIDECRIGTSDKLNREVYQTQSWKNTSKKGVGSVDDKHLKGRFPANVILDEEAAKVLDEQSGVLKSGARTGQPRKNKIFLGDKELKGGYCESSSGGASRFFYCAKASKRERNEGLDRLEYIIENESWEKLDLKSDLMDIKELLKDTSEEVLMDDQLWSTDIFGSNTTDQFQKDMTSIISITLNMITELKTSNYFLSSNIKDCIVDALSQVTTSGLNLAENVKSLNSLKKTTIGEKMELALGVNLVVLKMLLKIKGSAKQGNFHSTVKPIKLMEYLIKLVTPPGGTVLDPFMGSGSTGIAAVKSKFNFVGMELSDDYFKIAEARIKSWG